MNAFLLLQGIETLAVRMDRHCDNALAVAQYFQNHPKIHWVQYAGLSNSPSKSFTRFIDALQLITRLVNIGDAKSLACHPASTTHRQLSQEELAKAGVTADMVRLSIGLEHIDDIIADIEQALAVSQS